MISRGLKIALVVAVVVAGVGTFTGFRLANAKLRERMDTLRRSQAESGRLREDNRRAKALLAQVAGDQAAAARAVQTEITRLRGEVAELEKRAEVRRTRLTAEAAVDAEALATNRDPGKGLTRLEYFQDVGQGTPTAAFQTVAWAALKGNEGVLAKLLVMSDAARERAGALIANLPENARGQWTPDKLAALTMTGLFSEVPAAQVLSEALNDATHATVVVRIPGARDDAKLAMELGATGWQVVVSEVQIKVLQKKMSAVAEPPAKK